MDYEIKKLEENQFEILIPLMQDCFGMDVHIDYFKWKYLQNPAGIVEGYYAVHRQTNEVAAYYGVIPQYYLIRGEKQKWFQSCDTMTHSNHRRKGLFQLLAKHCYSELSKTNHLVIVGFGGSESTPGFLKFGWKQLFQIRNYFRPSLLSKLYIGLKTNSVEPILLSENVEKFTAIKSNPNTINLFIDPEMFTWRLSNPLRKYKILGIRTTSNDLEAYIIYYIENNKAMILDVEYNSTKNLNRLLKKIAMSENVSGVLYFGQENGTNTKNLTKNFFFSNPTKKGPLSQTAPFITYTSDRNDDSTLENVANWCISPIYHDSI